VVGLFVAFEAVMLTAYHFETDRNRATIVFGGTVIAGAFALYAFLQGVEQRRSETAQALIQRWNAAEMLPIRLVLLDIIEDRLEPATLKRKEGITETDTNRGRLVTILNFFEEMAIATLHKSVNENLLYEFYGSIVGSAEAKLKDWIMDEQRIDEADDYCNFLVLAARWKQRKN